MDRLITTLSRHAGGRVALSYGAQVFTYADLSILSARLAAGLRQLGLTRGDRLAIWLPNIPAYLVALFACARLGIAAVAINTRFRETEVADIIERSQARALLFWPSFLNLPFLNILAQVPARSLARLTHAIAYSEDPPPLSNLPSNANHVQLIAFGDLLKFSPSFDLGHRSDGIAVFTTSGTTKAPKFVLHTQATVLDHASYVSAAFGYDRPNERLLQIVPLCGVFGFTQAMAGLWAGAELVLLPMFDEAQAVTLCAQGGITQFNGSDDMVLRLIAAAPASGYPKLRHIGFAAFGRNPHEVVAAGDKIGVPCFGLYGMSEVQALFARQAETASPLERAKAGGLPMAKHYRARVRDPETGRLLPIGEAGELELQGPSIMVGYLDDPAATQAAFTADGYFKTGDLGVMEADGRFTFLTRMGDVLRLGGYLVSPAEIEARLESHGSVAGAQVVGLETERGTRAVAFVVPRSGMVIDEKTLQAHCRNALAAFKMPSRIVAIEAFPVTQSANGTKIQRAKLREIAKTL